MKLSIQVFNRILFTVFILSSCTLLETKQPVTPELMRSGELPGIEEITPKAKKITQVVTNQDLTEPINTVETKKQEKLLTAETEILEKALQPLQPIETNNTGGVTDWMTEEAQDPFTVVETTQIPPPATAKAGITTTLNNSEMILIPAGDFIMGSNTHDLDEGPARKLFVPAFYIDKYEVTNAQYEQFIKITGYKSDGNWNELNSEDRKNHPVVLVSWNDASNFAKWANKRLPTEMEWEKAARGTDQRMFPWGNEFDSEMTNIFGDDDYDDSAPVGTFSEDKSPYGVYDMGGNVWEWVNDWIHPYPKSKFKSNNFKKFKILRGGSWNTVRSEGASTINRGMRHPKNPSSSIGFRCVRSE